MDPQIAAIHYLQNHIQNLDPVLQFFAFLGQPEFSLLIIPVIIWCINRHHGIRLLLLISISGAICEIIKIMVFSPTLLGKFRDSGTQSLSVFRLPIRSCTKCSDIFWVYCSMDEKEMDNRTMYHNDSPYRTCQSVPGGALPL